MEKFFLCDESNLCKESNLKFIVCDLKIYFLINLSSCENKKE